MPNVNSGGTPPLLPPSQLWAPRQGQTQPAAQQPAKPAQPTQPAPSQQVPAKLPPLPTQPPRGQAMPMLTFTSQPPPPTLGTKLTQLKDVIKNADSRLLDYYNVKLVKNDQGAITGYQLNGRNVTQQELQQHLLPQSGVLHRQISDLKAEITQTHQTLGAQVQLQFSSLAAAEQTSVRIQMQAVQVVYENFVNRLDQVDALIK